jgi:hypothetical protein
MMKVTTYITLAIAILLSGVAAYFSVLGLMEIFSASPEAIMVMAIVLETAKVSTAYWAHLHWKVLPGLIKTYLVVAVLILMGITSLGIYGFLAKAHIQQKAEISTVYDSKSRSLEASIANQRELLAEIDNQLAGIDAAIKETAQSSQRGFITKSYEINKKYIEDKQKLIELKEPIQQRILDLEQQKITVQSEKELSETKVGPLKYIANLVYGEATPAELNTAVRWLIVILITVFDPLAILLLIGTGYILSQMANPMGRVPVAVTRNTVKNMEEDFIESKPTPTTEPTPVSSKKIVVTRRNPG